MTNRRNINALMGDRNPRFHMFMNLKQNKEKIDLILKSKLKSQNTMDQVENTRRIVDEDLRLIFYYSKRVLSGQVKNGELINYDVPDWNALVSLAYFFMIVSTGCVHETMMKTVMEDINFTTFNGVKVVAWSPRHSKFASNRAIVPSSAIPFFDGLGASQPYFIIKVLYDELVKSGVPNHGQVWRHPTPMRYYNKGDARFSVNNVVKMWNARYGAEIVKRLDSFINKSSDGLTAKKLSQVYSSYDIVRKTTLGLYRSFGYREANFEGIYGSELNGFIKMGMFTRLIFHLDPGCQLWPEQLLKITEKKNEILLKFIQHNCPSIHRVMTMLPQSESNENSSDPNKCYPEDSV